MVGLFARRREDSGFERRSDEESRSIPQGLNLRSDGTDLPSPFCAEQNAQHARDREPGLRGKLASFLLANNHDVGLEIRRKCDGFGLALMKGRQEDAQQVGVLRGCGPDPLIVHGRLKHCARDRIGVGGQLLGDPGRYPKHGKLQSQEFETLDTGKI